MWLQNAMTAVNVVMVRLWQMAQSLLEEDDGASMVEYAILVALIAIVAIAAVQGLGAGIAQVFQNILGRIQGLGR